LTQLHLDLGQVLVPSRTCAAVHVVPAAQSRPLPACGLWNCAQ